MSAKKSNAAAYFLFGLFMVLPFLGWAGGHIYTDIVFDIHCGGRIKRAADANTVEIAQKELEAVIAYADQKGYTQGYTSVLWNTPSEDVGFWYNNLKTALEELKHLPPSATPLEKSNMLIKLRETLIDHKEKGDAVTVPSGLARFPNNTAWFWGGWISGIMGVIGGLSLMLWFKAWTSR